MSPTVMVVEDDDEIREALSDALADHGYRVYTAPNGDAAHEILKGIHRPLAIILDLMMPVMDGWQLLAVLGEDPDLARIPTLVITAAGREHVRPLIGRQVFVKPVRVDDLVHALRALEQGSPTPQNPAPPRA